MDLKREFIYFKTFENNWDNMRLTDDDLVELENILLENPFIGKIIQGTGGVRKMRFLLPNKKGKSGGARVLYVDYTSHEIITLMNAYPKGAKDNITEKEKKLLKSEVERFLKGLKK